MKITAVNVILLCDGIIYNVSSYANTVQGNKEAKAEFRELCIKNDIPEHDIEDSIKNGYAAFKHVTVVIMNS
jgi:hypothetical protein